MLNPKRLKIAFFGSSLVSSYWNGAATYYRGIIKALAERGHEIVFFEPDALDRQKHRDMDDPPWAHVVVYPPDVDNARRALQAAQGADIIVKASGVGVLDEWLEEAVVKSHGIPGRSTPVKIFWDVDAPATLESIHNDPNNPLRQWVPQYDFILTYGGGQAVVDAYTRLGARECQPIYNALDPDYHHPVDADARFEAVLGFLGNRLPDREARVREFFFKPMNAMPEAKFLLGGSGWDDCVAARDTSNLNYLGHVYTRDHNAFNCSTLAVLNINRDSMAKTGFSPPTRVFEAAGAGACLISDRWQGIEAFLEPGEEVLLADSGDDVVDILGALTPDKARRIGEAARTRVLAEHTYSHRALQFEALMGAYGAERASA